MMDENVFKSADSVVAMVADAGEDLTAATVQELYNAFYNKIDEAKKMLFGKSVLRMTGKSQLKNQLCDTVTMQILCWTWLICGYVPIA